MTLSDSRVEPLTHCLSKLLFPMIRMEVSRFHIFIFDSNYIFLTSRVADVLRSPCILMFRSRHRWFVDVWNTGIHILLDR